MKNLAKVLLLLALIMGFTGAAVATTDRQLQYLRSNDNFQGVGKPDGSSLI